MRMFTGDKAAGMVGSIAEVFPGAAYQRCTVHFYRNVLARVPKSKRPRVAAMLKAIHAMESREAAEAKALEVASELEARILHSFLSLRESSSICLSISCERSCASRSWVDIQLPIAGRRRSPCRKGVEWCCQSRSL